MEKNMFSAVGEKKNAYNLYVLMKHRKINKLTFQEKKGILEINNFIFLVPIIHYNYRGLWSSRWRSPAQITVQQKMVLVLKIQAYMNFFQNSLIISHLAHKTIWLFGFHHSHFWGQSSLHYLRLMLAKQDESVALKWVFPSPLSLRLFWENQHEHAKHSAVCSNETVLPFCCTLAQVILQLLQL